MEQVENLEFLNPNRAWVLKELDKLYQEWLAWEEEVSQIVDQSYEKGEKGKALFLIPVVRYPWVRSYLRMFGVERMDQEWKDRKVEGPDEPQLLMDIEQKGRNKIELGSTHFKIILTVSERFELVLHDAPELLDMPRVTDFSGGVWVLYRKKRRPRIL